MASGLPSPPTSRDSSPQLDHIHDGIETDADLKDITRHLDEVLEQYLEVLDEYSRLREQLSQAFVNGFMSLAHAQRASNLGPGRRYGELGYDGRMKALKRLNIDRKDVKLRRQDEQKTGSKLQHRDSKSPSTYVYSITSISASNASTQATQEADLIRYDSEPEKPSPEQNDGVVEPLRSIKEAEINQKKIDPAYRDPLTWYGILTPQPLRQAQKSFSYSIDILIPNITSTAARLQTLEVDIWSIRSRLGMMDQYATNHDS